MSTKLIVKDSQVPVRPQDLVKFVLVVREKLVAVRAEIRAIDKLGLADGVRKQKNDEAQMLAGALLDAEVKVGELTSEIPLGSGGNRGNQYTGGKKGAAPRFAKTKAQAIKELGLSKDQVKDFEVMAENKAFVTTVKREAKESGSIPRRSDALQKIKDFKRDKARKAASDKRAADRSRNKSSGGIEIDLRLGDCIKILPTIPDNSADLLLVDPFFNVGVKYNSNDDNMPDEDYYLWCKRWLTECCRVLKDGHFGVISTGDAKSFYVHKAILESGLTFHHYLKWYKGHNCQASHRGSSMFYRTELAFLVSKGKPDMHLINRSNFYQDTIFLEDVPSTQADVIDHPARRPVELYRFIIDGFTQEGDTVLDPMAGSFSCGIAAEELGRRYIGIEIDEEYFKAAQERINNIKEVGSLEDLLRPEEAQSLVEVLR